MQQGEQRAQQSSIRVSTFFCFQPYLPLPACDPDAEHCEGRNQWKQFIGTPTLIELLTCLLKIHACIPVTQLVCAVLGHSDVSSSLRPHGMQPSRLLCPRGFSRQEHWSEFLRPPPDSQPTFCYYTQDKRIRVSQTSSVRILMTAKFLKQNVMFPKNKCNIHQEKNM